MNAADEKRESDAKAIWSVTWRSVVLVPFLFPLAVLWLILVILIGIVPLVSVAYLCFGQWRDAAIHFFGWAVLLYAYRRLRLGRWFEWPSSVL